MKKTIIALWGHKSQGKSDTIRRVVLNILKSFPASSCIPIEINYNDDINVTITIGSIRIGIESQGDPNSRIFDSLNKFAKDNCDIIICATRTSGRTVEVIEDLKKTDGYDIYWVTNIRSEAFDNAILNEISANQIVDFIQFLINQNPTP